MTLSTCNVKSVLVGHMRREAEELIWPRALGVGTLEEMPRTTPEEDDFALRLGSVISKVRLDVDLSQENLAEAAGVSVATIGRWERGVNPPKSYQLAKIWIALNEAATSKVPAEWLLKPPDAMSELDRRIASKVEEGRVAAYRPRRRATRRGADGHAAQPARRRPPGRRGSSPK